MVSAGKVAHASRLNAARFFSLWSVTSNSVKLLDLLIEAAERHFPQEPTHAFHAIVVETNLELTRHDPNTADVEEIVRRVLLRMIGTAEPEVSVEHAKDFNADSVLGKFTGEAVFVCIERSCRSANVSIVPLQTRAADEDVTVFYKCNACTKQWRR